jgi:hypothetical protein
VRSSRSFFFTRSRSASPHSLYSSLSLPFFALIFAITKLFCFD